MAGNQLELWRHAVLDMAGIYRQMIDDTLSQLTDAELHTRPAPGFNSVAILLRHLGGNLRSRWTDFLTTDGEKPDRDRDAEFEDWQDDRDALIEFFESGWSAFTAAIQQLNATNITETIFIRGESHTVPQALNRSITHISYHVGQLVFVARLVHDGDWKWLTIPPRQSK